MKLPANRVAEFLRKPPATARAALFYGPDAGLVRERADRLAAAICPDLRDPFRVAELTGPALTADPARLADEFAALSLVGGRRVIRLRETGDGTSAIVASALDATSGDSLLVLEAGDLPPRSSLRKLCEAAPEIAAVACYADTPRDLAEVAREQLAAHRIAASQEAIQYLVAHLGNDRMVTRQELEKLALYAGDGGRVELADAMESVGDSTALELDDLVFAVAEGDLATLDWALGRAVREGQNAIGILRAVMRHFQRLHLAAARVAAGASPEEAVKALRPPPFFKLQDRFAAQLTAWSPRRAVAALEALTRAELDGKRTALPQETVLGEALVALAAVAARAKRSARSSAGQRP
jgi:DNA polymerase-3 subunit delta